jgi:hypothetical protein
MGMRRLRYVFAVCGAGVLLAVVAQAALAASEHTPSSSAAAKAGAAPAAHRKAAKAHPKTAHPAPHRAAVRKDHKTEAATRPATSPAGSADKPSERRPLFGPFSVGVETDPKVKARSIRGGEYDPERDGDQARGLRPPFLGLSLKSQFSW